MTARAPFFLILCGAAVLAGCGDASDGEPISIGNAMREGVNPQRAELLALEIGDTTIEVEIAGRGVGLNLGLMFRRKMGQNEGMWFEFDGEEFRRFWMKNTHLPLSIAYVDAKGVITNIEDMVPYNMATTPSVRKVKYALEMNRGWFEKKKIKAGDTIKIGEKRKNPNAGKYTPRTPR